jgi:hypothetical protein
MTIFFSASVYGKDQFGDRYQKIVDLVKSSGHRIIADHILLTSHEEIQKRSSKDDNRELKKILEDVKRSDAVFVELSHASTSVGFFIAQALNLGKPVIIFFGGTQEPHILKSLESFNEKMAVVRYRDIADLEREVPLMIDFVSEVQDTRFNFFVSPSIATYLDWVSKEKRVPRSVYLRRLIDQDMSGNDEYNQESVG